MRVKPIRSIKLLLPLLFFWGVSFQSLAQSPSAKDIAQKFFLFNQRILQEKIYVHTDKATYLSGETIWFKVYEVDGTLHKPLPLSRVAYVELIMNGHPAAQIKVPMQNGSGDGFIELKGFSGGVYTLRCYTRWMRNFDEAFFYQQNIEIIDPLQAKNQERHLSSERLLFDIFPEGGKLVSGLTSRVAFKGTDRNGMGLSFKGYVVNSKGDTVTSFAPSHHGMGTFDLLPQSGESYKMHVTYDDKTYDYPIQDIQAEGFVMHMDDSNSQFLSIKVSYQGKNVVPGLILISHSRNSLKEIIEAPFQNNVVVFKVDRSKLADGISHITIFDNFRQPICERLFFKKPENRLLIDAKVSATHLGSRRPVQVSIGAIDQTKKRVVSNLSLAVYRSDSTINQDQISIDEYLLLTSDLRGAVENPSYYFMNDASGEKAADLLMLTHGWRRFKWDNILYGRPPQTSLMPEYEGMIISGTIMDNSSRAPLRQGVNYLSVPGKEMYEINVAKTDNNGRFEHLTDIIYAQKDVVIQNQITNPAISIDSPFHPISDVGTKAGHQTEYVAPGDEFIHMQVENIFAPKSIVTAPKPRIPFSGKPDKQYSLDDYVRFPTVEEVFKEYVPDVLVRKHNKKMNLYLMNSDTESVQTDQPLILIDGVPFFDVDKVAAMSAKPISKIEVFTHKYIYGDKTFHGILNLSTYTGDLKGIELDPGTTVIEFEGLQQHREFYSPKYSETEIRSRIPDFRTLLLWQPVIITSDEKDVSLEFFTSDNTGSFLGVLQGLSADGTPGATTFKFRVD